MHPSEYTHTGKLSDEQLEGVIKNLGFYSILIKKIRREVLMKEKDFELPGEANCAKVNI